MKIIGKKYLANVVLLLCGIATLPVSHAQTSRIESKGPTNIIFDTDMWSDIDDAMALAMLHSLQDRHEINLLAVTVSTDERWCAPYVDLVDNFYGHVNIPIGVVHDGLTVESFRHKFPSGKWPATRYTETLSTEKRNGALLYPHRLVDGTNAPDAVTLLRKTMAVQPDGSVVVIQVGYSTNLARLLDSPADEVSSLNGRDLVQKKVHLLSVMAGNFGDSQINGKLLARGSIEFNLVTDVPSAQKLFSRWPTPIVASGFEIGLAMPYPATSIERDFSYVKDHPIVETYRRFAEDEKMPWPHDHPTFDLTSVLYAVRPDRNYFALSDPGRITVLDDGSSRFDETPDGAHRFLIMNEEQKVRTLEAMVMLVSQPPKR